MWESLEDVIYTLNWYRRNYAVEIFIGLVIIGLAVGFYYSFDYISKYGVTYEESNAIIWNNGRHIDGGRWEFERTRDNPNDTQEVDRVYLCDKCQAVLITTPNNYSSVNGKSLMFKQSIEKYKNNTFEQ